MIERWILHDDGSIAVPGIDYGPKALLLAHTVKDEGGKPLVFVARSFGHKMWAGSGESTYAQASWYIAQIVKKQEPKVRPGYAREIASEWSVEVGDELAISRA